MRKQRTRRILSAFSLAALGGWLFLANLGCANLWDEIRTYTIIFSPDTVVVEPGKTKTATATLQWAEEYRSLEASEWLIDGAVPEVLASATVNPKKNAPSTTLTLVASASADHFAGADEWGWTPERTSQLGVQARFVDPTWKSLSGGQEAIISRKAYLPLRHGIPRILVRQIGIDAEYYAIFELQVQNHLGNTTYSYLCNYVGQLESGGYKRENWGGTAFSVSPYSKNVAEILVKDMTRLSVRFVLRVEGYGEETKIYSLILG